MSFNDTIAAIATPPGKGGVGIVRISGSKGGNGRTLWEMADQIFESSTRPSQAQGGTFLYGTVIAANRQAIDEALCLIFHAPKSYTGEDSIEIQGHGGSVVLKNILRRCLEAGARMAEPGEFSQRAFLNGKMDLVQAEAVADLIHAQSDRAVNAAFEQLAGGLSQRFNTLYNGLMKIAADLEHTLDFMEDELPDDVFPVLGKKLDQSFQDLENLLATWEEGQLLREGARVVILGRPNAGKSTLFNALLGHDRAIVTAIAGTTRDVIEETLILDGIPLRVLDTAGLRETDCLIEQEGIRRARAHSATADIALYLIDSSQPLSPYDEEHLSQLDPARTIVVVTKTDSRHLDFQLPDSGAVPVEISLLDPRRPTGICSALLEKLSGLFQTPAHAVISERHRNLLVRAQNELIEVQNWMSQGGETSAALASEHLRTALEALGQITGRIYHNDLLDQIFSHFCTGK